MPKFMVSIGKEVAFDADIVVDAADEDEARELALEKLTPDMFEEGDWESGATITDVHEIDEDEDEIDEDEDKDDVE